MARYSLREIINIGGYVATNYGVQSESLTETTKINFHQEYQKPLMETLKIFCVRGKKNLAVLKVGLSIFYAKNHVEDTREYRFYPTSNYFLDEKSYDDVPEELVKSKKYEDNVVTLLELMVEEPNIESLLKRLKKEKRLDLLNLALIEIMLATNEIRDKSYENYISNTFFETLIFPSHAAIIDRYMADVELDQLYMITMQYGLPNHEIKTIKAQLEDGFYEELIASKKAYKVFRDICDFYPELKTNLLIDIYCELSRNLFIIAEYEKRIKRPILIDEEIVFIDKLKPESFSLNDLEQALFSSTEMISIFMLWVSSLKYVKSINANAKDIALKYKDAEATLRETLNSSKPTTKK